MTRLEIVADPPVDAIRRLLDEASLPSSDIAAGPVKHFFAVRGVEDGQAAAIIGLEPCGAVALLRSLVVRPSERGAGLGAALLAHAEQRAGSMGIETLYLLTNTAPEYFRRRGYRDCPRRAAPPAIRSTREFNTLCPDDAVFMRKRLKMPGVVEE